MVASWNLTKSLFEYSIPTALRSSLVTGWLRATLLTVTLMRDAGNIFHYDFKTKRTRKVTQLENEFAHSFTISPDGAWIVYERSKTHEDDTATDLSMVKIDDSGYRLLVRTGMRPSWGKP